MYVHTGVLKKKCDIIPHFKYMRCATALLISEENSFKFNDLMTWLLRPNQNILKCICASFHAFTRCTLWFLTIPR